jgi:calcineurin-like phosphoesterase family protein
MKQKIDIKDGKTKLFFTSDFHLFHKNVLRFDNRPFKNVGDMHEEIINKWNHVVGENDVVYYLGDLTFAKAHEISEVNRILDEFNGKIHFIIGNHDDDKVIRKFNRFETINDYVELKVTHNDNDVVVDTLVCLFHYPIYSWNKAHYGSIHLHGHSHGNLHHGEDASYYVNRRVIDVGCMLTDYQPIIFEEVYKKLISVIIKK